MKLNLKIKKNFKVNFIENTWINLKDKNKLAASIWLPKSKNKKFPTILEYIPYRKRDATAIRDSLMHPYYAANGYACIRVDMRGSGDSDGIMKDEYLPQETKDGIEIIDWITKQKWFDGKIGMTGVSWGGIVCLQMAICQPKALKAIIPVHYSVDRYYDDAGYFLGCYPGQTVGWGALMDGFNSRPPDPLISGKEWKRKWINRLNKTDSFLKIWLSHQQNDKYWLNTSISQNFSKIKIPVLAVGGWADCWPNSVINLLKNINAKSYGIIGPWGHTYPHVGKPGPAINFLQESLKFFDSYLQNENKNLQELRLWITESHSPNPKMNKKKGYWVSLNKDELNTRNTIFYFGHHKLSKSKNLFLKKNLSISSSLTCGLSSGEYMPWFASGYGAELPDNQIIDDSESLVFDTEKLKKDFIILGEASLNIQLSSNKNFGKIATRLCEIDENGNSNLITFGIVNLSQIRGKNINYKIKANKKYNVNIKLNHTGYKFKKNNKIRISLSTSYWPMAWPLKEKFTLKIYIKNSLLKLPEKNNLKNYNSFKKPKNPLPIKNKILIQPKRQRKIIRDLEQNSTKYFVEDYFGKIKLIQANLITENYTSQEYYLNEDNPLSAEAKYNFRYNFERRNWLINIDGNVKLTCNKKYFFLNKSVCIKHNLKTIYSINKNYKIIRKGF